MLFLTLFLLVYQVIVIVGDSSPRYFIILSYDIKSSTVNSLFLGKELENCTHEWTTNDDTDKQALSTLSLLQVKEQRQQQKEERSRDENREGGCQLRRVGVTM